MADLLFLTPLLPSPTGHGSAMRASASVEVLAERHDVFVVNLENWGSQKVSDAWVRKYAAGYATIPPVHQPDTVERVLRDVFPGRNFMGVYAFRLITAPLAIQFASRLGPPAPRMALDMDDNEVERAQRFLPLREESGDLKRAATERAELGRLQAYMKVLMPRFDVILLAAERDRRAQQAWFPNKTFLQLRNTMRLAPPAIPIPSEGSLLFVGGLDYLPNEDGIVHFCRETLPLIHQVKPECRVRVVGNGATQRVLDLAMLGGVTLPGFVPDLAPEYSQAQMAIVPLRAGSGTRIKILEAISYGRPIVSTSAGAEGLDLRHEEHCLLADTPAEFAAACLRLMSDANLRGALVNAASEWLAENHSMDQVRSVLHPLFP